MGGLSKIIRLHQNVNNDRHELNEEEQFRQQALDYHAFRLWVKFAISITKPADSAKILLWHTALVLQNLFVKSHKTLITFKYTPKANMVAVILTGTAILGLGNLRDLWLQNRLWKVKLYCSKRFANLNSIDIK